MEFPILVALIVVLIIGIIFNIYFTRKNLNILNRINFWTESIETYLFFMVMDEVKKSDPSEKLEPMRKNNWDSIRDAFNRKNRAISDE